VSRGPAHDRTRGQSVQANCLPLQAAEAGVFCQLGSASQCVLLRLLGRMACSHVERLRTGNGRTAFMSKDIVQTAGD